MEKIRRHPAILLVVILLAFFLKEVFLADLFPMFTGQDEARHYNTVQYLSYPRLPQEAMSVSTEKQDKNRLETYRFSTEIKNTIVAAGLDANRENSFNKMSFAPNSFNGQNENEIKANHWLPVNETYPPDIVYGSLYHKAASFIEKALAGQNILVRFYAARLFSISLGTLALFFFYLAIKNFGFSRKATLAIFAILSFQPRFSIYYTSVNYDALLILAFAIFFWAGTLILKNGPSWKNIGLLAATAWLGYLDKGTGIVLIAAFIFFMAFLLWKKLSLSKKNSAYLAALIFVLSTAIILFAFGKYLPLNGSHGLLGIFVSLWEYLSKSITPGRLSLSARTYWGTLGWTDSHLLDSVVDFIQAIEILSLIGLAWFLKRKETPDYLPEKKYVWFAIGLVIALQLGIRLADWRNFAASGSLELGTPGRYFIPNLAAHIALVFVGLGTLVRKKKYFEDLLSLGAVLMFCFMAYLIFDVIIFRFYL